MANINQTSPDGGTTVYDIEDTPVRSSIARIEDGTSPSAKINKDEEFYHLNVLYKATQDIATTDTITPNSNCEVSPSVTSQIAQKADKSDLGTASTKNSTSVVTESSDLVESGAVKDIVGWGNKNLLDPSLLSSGSLIYVPIYVGDGDFTISTTTPLNIGNNANLFFFAGNVQSGGSTSTNGVWNGQTRTVTAVNGYVTVASRVEGEVDVRDYNTQLEKGSTATAYEPYHESVEEYIPQVVSDAVGWDVGNLFAPSASVETQTINGVTFTVKRDAQGNIVEIDANGTATGSNAQFNLGTYTGLDNGVYQLSGCPQGGSDNTYLLFCVEHYSDGTSTLIKNEIGNGVNFIWRDGTLDFGLSLIIVVGTTVNHIKYHPSIIHVSVDEQKADNSVIAPVENGATASQAYAVGEHFIRDGAFCTCTQTIAQGGTFILNTNYTAGDVASALSVYSIQSTINLADVNWNNTSGGVKYADVLEISDSTKILAVTFGNWSSLNNALVIQPYISSAKKVGLMINDDTYASGTILLHVLYLK